MAIDLHKQIRKAYSAFLESGKIKAIHPNTFDQDSQENNGLSHDEASDEDVAEDKYARHGDPDEPDSYLKGRKFVGDSKKR